MKKTKETKISCNEKTRLLLKKLAKFEGRLMASYIDLLVEREYSRVFKDEK